MMTRLEESLKTLTRLNVARRRGDRATIAILDRRLNELDASRGYARGRNPADDEALQHGEKDARSYRGRYSH